MMVWVLLGIVIFFGLLAALFRKTLKTAESPQPVLEDPPWPRDLAAVVRRLDRWRAEGRLSRADHERLMDLCREDAGPAQKQL
jgi:uncharacterized iron-regulated membrane protein